MTAEDEVHCLSVDASDEERRRQYESVNERLTLLISGERDLTAVLATIVCELHHAFEYYHWTVRMDLEVSLQQSANHKKVYCNSPRLVALRQALHGQEALGYKIQQTKGQRMSCAYCSDLTCRH